LDLTDNGIRGESAADLSAFVEMNEQLETLNLSRNFLNKNDGSTRNRTPDEKRVRNFVCSDLSRLIKSLYVYNETVRALILQWNGISGEVSANLFKNLMIKTNGVRLLDLGFNE